MTDLLIHGGRIIDGSGSPAFNGDVTVERGSITGVLDAGDRGEARVTVDATGLIVCPGFIDMHAHSELALLTDPEHMAKVAQGVTTEVLGQDGLSYAPADAAVLADLRDRLRAWNGDPPSVSWSWRTVGEFLSEFNGRAVNVAYLVPHGTVRLLVIGSVDRPASPDELEQMANLVRTAMAEGAFGLSTGLTYAPGMYADDDELAVLCEVVAAAGGYYSPHHRNYGSRAIESYAECIALGDRTGVPVHLTHAHLGYDVNRGRAGELLSMVDDARRRGVDVTLDSYPYLAAATLLHSLLPGWVQEGDPASVIRSLTDRTARARLRSELKEGTTGTQGIPVDWSAIVITSANEPQNEALIGATIEAAAARRGADPFDLYFDLLVEERLGSGCLLHIGNEENVRAIMRHAMHMPGSDGLLHGQHPHPRVYGTFPRYLGHYSRDLGVVKLEEMVRKMTSLPARRLGLADRGLLRPGHAADIVCFDPGRVRDNATYEEPRRLPDGIPHVIVNGEQVVVDGRHTGALPGRALRRREG